MSRPQLHFPPRGDDGLDLVGRLRVAAAMAPAVELTSDDVRGLIRLIEAGQDLNKLVAEQTAALRTMMDLNEAQRVALLKADALLARRAAWTFRQIVGVVLNLALALVGALYLIGWLS